MTNNIIIVGKPNVGKSSLFNALVKKNLALVDNSPRYTRDIKKKNFVLFDQEVTLIDSPGLFEPKDKIEEKIIQYTKDQISRSDLILLVFNAKEELSNDDHRLVSLIRKCEKKKIIILNKTEGKFNSNIVNDIEKFGFGLPILISSAHMKSIELLKEKILQNLEFKKNVKKFSSNILEKLSIAIVGKTNSGKSTLMNSISGQDVSVTGNTPYLTRDAVEISIERKKLDFKIIDTAGFSKDLSGSKKLNKNFIDQTKKKIRLSQMILIVMDIDDYFERLHSRVIRLVSDENRCMIIVINKIDKYKKIYEESVKKKIYDLNPQINGLPVCFISAKKKLGISSLFKLVVNQNLIWKKRISTGKLNNWINGLVKKTPPPLHKGRSVKFKYIAQVNTAPPKFNIFVNYTQAIKSDYKRFLENNIRKNFNLKGLPIKIIYKKSKNPFNQK